ncbi:MAG: hypothetical protein A3H61_02885 [Candidatus Jacksonbacteria bacterium RIFCSPLOWO2_02_FULL_44_20]|uniref:Polymerase beta nucleotidyltransferase domain-containing protein n=1 Tax=Candidatus Jacksonbacteria bacterium RIFCSPLOWO2_02_FULL_44_20 TaxID=1798460 RepID=A0A1G2AAS3_9BACT|nr:MAG: hypothetical protein A3E05_04330 [Candidatus Jacksonbacteria bacterium RIFCSPHIGHO2_12_FULL_44_12]OGY72891.1 MAG: hypothetical protein A3H07_02905 [Candidatus Jacksonbacteria bacterium RIFCSPLOWO2_12_FULL_44_15b]OGY73127.1 MAG: hypothetical protein A3H61_02885 [Candidatus Jacksonbacteria bacterium RIFCSPLOWO2_02_FULL_44_20]HCA66797.1 nucleotidyltransferase domain-containing protein [Candidatus Jacksonbacteria bacterium]HCE86348.1 nucleotidyltransferase domain-containing protein [Candida
MTPRRQSPKLTMLKKYVTDRDDVLMAFLFGSRSKGREKAMSDWDIGVYFKPETQAIEWEVQKSYPVEDAILGDVIKLLGTDNVDLLVLNRVPSTLAASALAGSPLVIKDRKTYLSFLLRVTGEAEDFREFTKDYARIYWRS